MVDAWFLESQKVVKSICTGVKSRGLRISQQGFMPRL